MTVQHRGLAEGRWRELTLSAQLANVGAEVGRALRWQEKGNADSSNRAFERALELIDLTIADDRHRTRLKEITRLREAVVDYFVAGNTFGQTADSLNRYFYPFNVFARAAGGKN